jgi:dihydrolipoamide dehydrogenase
MAANDGPVPVRTLAQAARLIREARQLPRYGIAGGEPALDFPRLLARVREVTAAAREQTLLRDDVERAGVRIYEQAGPARFADAHTVESDNAPRLQADRVIICTGGSSRPLPVPGFDLTATHSDVESRFRRRCWCQHARPAQVTPRLARPPRPLHPDERGPCGLKSGGANVVEDAGTIDR